MDPVVGRAVKEPLPFADRLAGLVEARSSQLCLGLDPDPSRFSEGESAGGEPRVQAAAAASAWAARLIESVGPACVAVKPQLARYEALGPPGYEALEQTVARAREAGLLVIADGKRGDVPDTAAAYADALIGETQTPWGPVPGLGVDAFTANALLGGDALEPFVLAAERASAGVFALVRTSNPGAVDLFDAPTPDGPLHERIARMVADRSERLLGSSGISGMAAVVGATAPRFLERLRELMPAAVFLLPGVGAQGGSAALLGAARGPHPAATLITASRSIAGAPDPRGAADRLRDEAWATLGG